MTDNMEALAVGIIHYIPTVLGIFIGYLWNKARGLSEKRDKVEAAMRVILKRELIKIYDESTARGYITMYDEGIAEEIYTHYHGLGGNGQGTKIIGDIRLLTRPKE